MPVESGNEWLLRLQNSIIKIIQLRDFPSFPGLLIDLGPWAAAMQGSKELRMHCPAWADKICLLVDTRYFSWGPYDILILEHLRKMFHLLKIWSYRCPNMSEFLNVGRAFLLPN